MMVAIMPMSAVARSMPLRTRRDAAEDGGDFGDLIGHADDGGAVDAESIFAHQRLAGKLEKNPFV